MLHEKHFTTRICRESIVWAAVAFVWHACLSTWRASVGLGTHFGKVPKIKQFDEGRFIQDLPITLGLYKCSIHHSQVCRLPSVKSRPSVHIVSRSCIGGRWPGRRAAASSSTTRNTPHNEKHTLQIVLQVQSAQPLGRLSSAQHSEQWAISGSPMHIARGLQVNAKPSRYGIVGAVINKLHMCN